MRRAFWLASGVVVWALHFTAAYGYTGLACARGMAASVPWVVGIATAVGAAAAGALVARGLRHRGDFEAGIGAGLAAFALLAILWEGVSIFMVPPCG